MQGCRDWTTAASLKICQLLSDFLLVDFSRALNVQLNDQTMQYCKQNWLTYSKPEIIRRCVYTIDDSVLRCMPDINNMIEHRVHT